MRRTAIMTALLSMLLLSGCATAEASQPREEFLRVSEAPAVVHTDAMCAAPKGEPPADVLEAAPAAEPTVDEQPADVPQAAEQVDVPQAEPQEDWQGTPEQFKLDGDVQYGGVSYTWYSQRVLPGLQGLGR